MEKKFTVWKPVMQKCWRVIWFDVCHQNRPVFVLFPFRSVRVIFASIPNGRKLLQIQKYRQTICLHLILTSHERNRTGMATEIARFWVFGLTRFRQMIMSANGIKNFLHSSKYTA
jgi:hypothetical protein